MPPTNYTRSNGGNSSPGAGQSASVNSPSSQLVGTPLRLDFDQVDTSSTYAALSSCVKLLVAAGRRQPNFVSHAELDLIIQEFEARLVDLSDILGFPYGADDLEDCIFLLARLQNRMAMRGIKYTSCTLREIIADALVDRSHKSHRYDIGEWIEVRGPSMKFRLERIIDVVRTSDNEFFYETPVDHKLREVQLQWPRESLIRIFGVAPWVWRQWACLKLENKLRFQEGNPDDFEILDIRAYALELWELWLADQRNEAFRQLFERVGSSGQEELIQHILAPFNLMNEVVTNADGQWDLDAAVTSMFTYMSLLGTGFVDAFIVFLLQVTIPIILFFYYTSPARQDDEINVGTRGMLFAVMVYYMYKLNRGEYFGDTRRIYHAISTPDMMIGKLDSFRYLGKLCQCGWSLRRYSLENTKSPKDYVGRGERQLPPKCGLLGGLVHEYWLYLPFVHVQYLDFVQCIRPFRTLGFSYFL